MNSKTLCIHWISGTKQRIYASASFRCAFVAVTVFVSQNVLVCVSFKVRNVFFCNLKSGHGSDRLEVEMIYYFS